MKSTRRRCAIETLESRQLLSVSVTDLGIDVPTYTDQHAVVNGVTYFSASERGVNNFELWRTDGTVAGTWRVKEINPGATSTTILYMTGSGNNVYFTARDVNGLSLWRSDGTEAGTIPLRQFNNGQVGSLFDANGTLYFSGFTDNDGFGRELWRTNGTAATTFRISDIMPGQANSDFLFFHNWNGKTYFGAESPGEGIELYVTDGTSAGTKLVKNINPGQVNGYPVDYVEFNGKLYFSAQTASTGMELWVTDGTTNGTKLVRDFTPGSTGSFVKAMTVYNNALYLTTSPTGGLSQMWKMDTAGNFTMVKQFASNPNSPYASNSTYDMYQLNGKLIFNAADDTHSIEPWISDGTTAGTQMLKELKPGGGVDGTGSGGEYYVTNGIALFPGNSAAGGVELWQTDGTAAGTTQVVDSLAGTASGSPGHMVLSGNKLFFSAYETPNGRRRLYVATVTPTTPPPTPPTVTVVANDASASEAGPNAGQFTVSRTGPTTSALTVYYGLPTSVGSATNISDYLALSGSVTIAAGATSATITVVPIDDSVVEGTETVAVALSTSSGYVLGSQVTATVTITDNDTVTPPPTNPPAAPSGIAGTVVSGNRIDVRWTDNATNETGFEIQRSAVYNFLNPTNVTVNTANLTGYSDTTLSPNTYYYFRVRTLNAAGVSGWSGSVKLKTSSSGTTPTPTVPAMPTGPGATANSSSQITVNWTDASNNETGFRIQRSSNSTFTAGLAEFTVGAGVTSFVNTGLAANTTYYYRVQSYNGTGPSAYTAGVSATTQAVTQPTVPAVPASPNATANSSSQITVNWTDASNNETGFRIQRSTTSNFTSVTEFTVGAGVTSFANTGLAANTTYYYRVQSYNGIGPSSYTAGVNATTQPAPTGGTGPLTAPNGLAVTVSRLSALVNWNDNSNNESGWEIQISTVYNFTTATTRTVSVPTLNAESFNVTGLTASTWYYFRVRAVNSTNVSSWTGSLKLKTLS